MTEHIRINKWPADHAKDAYDSGYYIEALQTLHGWLEIKMRELLQLQRVEIEAVPRREEERARIWNMTEELSLIQITKTLYITGIISEAIHDRINTFNRVRNNLIHKLFHDPYEKVYKSIPKLEYDLAFNEGVELGYLIENMSARRAQ
jgi:hypothetical protein